MITTAALIALFLQALDELWGYIWGTKGEKWTAAKQANLEKTTDADRANSRKYGAKWIGHRVADCSGLFAWAFKQLGGYMYHGSDTMWRKYCTAKGELKNGKRTDGKELLPGTAVFTYNSKTGKRGHVGLYIGGGGYVIEARGAYYGVVKTKLTARPWVEWGELKGVDYQNGTAPEPEPDPQEETFPTLKRGSKGKYVTLLQVKLISQGYSCGSTGADGDFGANTEKAVKNFQRDHDGPDGRALKIDGIVGAATWWALDHAPERITYTVTIKNMTAEQKDKLMKEYPGATATPEN